MKSVSRSSHSVPRILTPRATCFSCRRPTVACYCSHLRPFDPGFDLVLLVHPREAKNPVGTARMLHRFTRGSLFVEGTGAQLERDPFFQGWLTANQARTALLYPGPDAIQLTPEKGQAWARGRARPAILLIDGTWSQATGLIRDCKSLQALPQIAFQPAEPSRYQIREQPDPHCLSSLEAVVELCRLLQVHSDPGPAPMLEVFEKMVHFQMQSEAGANPVTFEEHSASLGEKKTASGPLP